MSPLALKMSSGGAGRDPLALTVLSLWSPVTGTVPHSSSSMTLTPQESTGRWFHSPGLSVVPLWLDQAGAFLGTRRSDCVLAASGATSLCPVAVTLISIDDLVTVTAAGRPLRSHHFSPCRKWREISRRLNQFYIQLAPTGDSPQPTIAM